MAHDATELHATFYHHWDEARPFHTDFVFVPMAWPIEAVEVGSCKAYLTSRLSDYAPVVVTVTDPE